MNWIANASYDGVVGLTEIIFDEALSKTCETTEHLSLYCPSTLRWNVPLLPPVARMVVFVDIIDCKEIGDMDVDQTVGFQRDELLFGLRCVTSSTYRKHRTPLTKPLLIAGFHIYYSAKFFYILLKCWN